MTLLFPLWLACSSPSAPVVPEGAPAGQTLELPGDFEHLPVPTQGAELTSHEGQELVLNYPGGEVRPLVEAYVNALDKDGWALEAPQDGGRFVRVEAHKGSRTLEFFVVAQPERAEVHMELTAQ
jgi:hypothetical protein